jgi:hypothetical protein
MIYFSQRILDGQLEGTKATELAVHMTNSFLLDMHTAHTHIHDEQNKLIQKGHLCHEKWGGQ